jgi:hypothetical protein
MIVLKSDILPAESGFVYWPPVDNFISVINPWRILYFYIIKKSTKPKFLCTNRQLKRQTSLLQLLETKDLLQRGEIKRHIRTHSILYERILKKK